jgi:hypothetical protein
MGTVTENLQMCDPLEDIVIVQLDEGNLLNHLELQPVPLPSRRRHKLLNRLRRACQLFPAGPPHFVSESFPFGKLRCSSSKSACKQYPPRSDSSLPGSHVRAQLNKMEALKNFKSAAELENARKSKLNKDHFPAKPFLHTNSSVSLKPNAPSMISFASTATRFSIFSPSTASPAGRKIVEGHSLQEQRKPNLTCAMCDSREFPLWKCEGCDLVIHSDCTTKILDWCSRSFDEEKILQSFVKIYASILRNYRLHFKEGSKFDSNQFVLAEPESKDFLEMLVRTQAFAQFIQDRTSTDENSSQMDQEIVFFDEAIKLKTNKFLFARADASFFQDPSFTVSSTYRPPLPVEDGTIKNIKFDISEVILV